MFATIAKVGQALYRFAKTALKNANRISRARNSLGVDDEGKSNLGKIAVSIIAVFFIALMMISIILQTFFIQALCWGILGKFNDGCPKKIFDDKDKLAELMQEKRTDTVNKDPSAEDFQFTALGDKYLGDEKDRPGPAEYYLMVLEQLDTDIIMGYPIGNNPKIEEGGDLEDSNLSSAYIYAKKKINKTDKVSITKDEKLKKRMADDRMNLWACFLIGNKCYTGNVNEQIKDHKNILGSMTSKTVTNKDGEEEEVLRADYKQLKSMFEHYYEISLYYGLPDGKSQYEKRLKEIFQALNFEEMIKNRPGMGLGFGYFNVPMEAGTYYRSSQYGQRTLQGKLDNHLGTDLAAHQTYGVPIYSTSDGVVIDADFRGAAGYQVTIVHSNGYRSVYMHMEKDYMVVKKGQNVQAGQLIGAIGNTGTSTGPHLHFELCKEEEQEEQLYGCKGNKNEYPNVTQMDTEKEPFFLVYEEVSADYKKRDEKVEWFKRVKESAKEGEVYIKEDVVVPLGSVVIQSESGGDQSLCYNDVSVGTGGTTCGLYQIETNHGTSKEFHKIVEEYYPELYKELSKIRPENTSFIEYEKHWKDMVNKFPQEMLMAQHLHAYRNIYRTRADHSVRNGGIDPDDLPRGIQEAFFSMAMQHGYHVTIGGRSGGIQYASGMLGNRWKEMKIQEMLDKMYKVRNDHWNFSSRYDRELRETTQMIKDENVSDMKAKDYIKGKK